MSANSTITKGITFGLKLDSFTPLVKSIEKLTTGLLKIKKPLMAAQKVISPFIIGLKADPLTALLKVATKTLLTSINSLVSTGVGVIFMSPYTTPTKRYLDMSFDILNPITEAMTATTTIIEQTKWIQEEREDRRRETVIKTPFDNKKYVSEMNHVLTKQIEKLSPTEAIQDIISSFTKKSLTQQQQKNGETSPWVPSWNEYTTTTGLGFIISAQTPLEFLKKLEIFNKLFNITSISNAYTEAINSYLDIEAIETKNEEIRIASSKNNPVIKDVQKFFLEYKEKSPEQKEQARIATIKKLNVLQDSLVTSYKSNATSGGWIGLSIEMLPGMEKIKKTISKFCTRLTEASTKTVGILLAIIEALFTKLTALIDMIDEFNTFFQELKALSVSVSALSFEISPAIGGVVHLIEGLQEVAKFNITSLSVQNTAGSTVLQNTRDSQFSAVLFLAGGGAKIDLILKQFKSILDIFVTTLNTFSATVTSETAGYSSALLLGSILVTPDFSPQTTTFYGESSISFSVILSPEIKKYTYTFTEEGMLLTTPIKGILVPTQAPSTFSVPITGLEDTTSYRLEIIGYDTNSNIIVSKVTRFMTNFSLSFDVYDGNPESGGYTGDSTGDSTGTGTGTNVTVSNNTDEILQSDTTSTTNNLPSTTYTLPNSITEIAIIDPTVETTVVAFPLSNPDLKKLKVVPAKTLLNKVNYSRLLANKKIFIKKEPSLISFPTASAITAIRLFIDENWSIFPTPVSVEVFAGTYPAMFLQDNVWSEQFSIEVILSTNVSDFCLVLQENY